MTRLIVVVGADSRQGSSVIEALLEYPDEWQIRGTTDNLTSFHSQVVYFENISDSYWKWHLQYLVCV